MKFEKVSANELIRLVQEAEDGSVLHRALNELVACRIGLNMPKETDGLNRMCYVDRSKTSFHCNEQMPNGGYCGCNVFQAMKNNPSKYVCNSCAAVYHGERYEARSKA